VWLFVQSYTQHTVYCRDVAIVENSFCRGSYQDHIAASYINEMDIHFGTPYPVVAVEELTFDKDDKTPCTYACPSLRVLNKNAIDAKKDKTARTTL